MATTATRPGPLARFTVIDLSRVRSGPTCARQFADWGADVIMIEAPEALNVSDGFGSDRHGGDFQNLHRNKRSMTLNLKDPAGIAILHQLVQRADVLIENFRPDVKYRLGIDYEALKRVNARLIYASISGYGQDGPYAKRAGFDQIAQGMGGLMSITGEPGRGPMRAGIAVADSAAGLYCAIGILTALLEREVSGEGQWLQVSLLQAMVAMLDFQGARWLVDKKIAQQSGNDHPTGIPTSVFPTADGYINIAASADAMWERLCKALGAEELLDRPEFKTPALRSQNRAQCHGGIAEYTRHRPSREWLEIFERAGVASGPINDIKEVFEDPQVRHLGMAVPVEHPLLGDIALIAQPFVLSRTPSEIHSVTAERGQHTDEVMRELGYGDGEIGEFRARRVI